jgi:hypothetical protein
MGHAAAITKSRLEADDSNAQPTSAIAGSGWAAVRCCGHHNRHCQYCCPPSTFSILLLETLYNLLYFLLVPIPPSLPPSLSLSLPHTHTCLSLHSPNFSLFRWLTKFQLMNSPLPFSISWLKTLTPLFLSHAAIHQSPLSLSWVVSLSHLSLCRRSISSPFQFSHTTPLQHNSKQTKKTARI